MAIRTLDLVRRLALGTTPICRSGAVRRYSRLRESRLRIRREGVMKVTNSVCKSVECANVIAVCRADIDFLSASLRAVTAQEHDRGVRSSKSPNMATDNRRWRRPHTSVQPTADIGSERSRQLALPGSFRPECPIVKVDFFPHQLVLSACGPPFPHRRKIRLHQRS